MGALEMASKNSRKWLWAVLGWLVAILLFFPIFWMFITSFKTEDKKDDFHWFLRVTGLTTGATGNPFSFDSNSLRGWLMRNGFDASQGIRSIMSTLSVSSVRQLIKSHT